jgi:hypothetical protein
METQDALTILAIVLISITFFVILLSRTNFACKAYGGQQKPSAGVESYAPINMNMKQVGDPSPLLGVLPLEPGTIVQEPAGPDDFLIDSTPIGSAV